MKPENLPFKITSTSSAILCINLQNISNNWKSLAQLVHPAECAAVIKADAYGLGLNNVMPCIYSAGCRTFFVATPKEAEEARNLFQDVNIFILDGLFSNSAAKIHSMEAIPCLSSFEEVNEWSLFAASIGKKLKSCIQIDSGLSRLGFDLHEIKRIFENKNILRNLEVILIMSHLANADDPLDPVNKTQLDIFELYRKYFSNAKASLAASDGLMLGDEFHYDLVRPGYALFGGQAIKDGRSPVTPVVSLFARILNIREISLGTSVGYSCTWKAQRKSTIAVVAIGYADGIPRSSSSTNETLGGTVRIHGFTCPIVGRVSMDLITVDVTDCPHSVQRGDFAEILSLNKSIEELGSEAGTIGYEILTRLGKRLDRIYYGL